MNKREYQRRFAETVRAMQGLCDDLFASAPEHALRGQCDDLIAVLGDELGVLLLWLSDPYVRRGLPADVRVGIAISIDKIERALARAKGGA